MIITSNNGIPLHNASLPSLHAQSATSPAATERKDQQARNFDQVVISARDSAQDSAKMNIKSKIYNDLQTATTTGTVAALRNQIASGEYKIDANEIARKMLLVEA